MNESKIPVRYSKALILLAKENNCLQDIADDINTIDDLYQNSDDFRIFFDDPMIRRAKKASVLSDIFKGKIHILTMNFLLFLVEKYREAHLREICRYYKDLSRAEQGIIAVRVTTALPLTDPSRVKIKQSLQQKTGKIIELTERVRPEIVGGLMLRIGHIQYDASISSRLKKIRESMVKSSY